MRPYDLIAIDLDGTLLDSRQQLSALNREALHLAHDAGLKVVLCTGRTFTETRPVLRQIGLDLDATVTVFGALVTAAATGRTLERTAIPLDTARSVTAWFGRLGYPVFWLHDPNENGSDGFLIDGPYRHPAVDRWLERTPCVVQQLPHLPETCAAPLRITIIDDEGALDVVSERLHREFDGRLTHNVLHAPPYSLSLIEAFAPQVNKWYGIERLCRRWKIDPRRTVAVGDDVNDLALLRNAGLGVAMGNARPSVREAADRLTGTNDEDGVALLIYELLESAEGRR